MANSTEKALIEMRGNNTVIDDTGFRQYDKYVSDIVFVYVTISFQTIAAGAVSILGIITNTINIIVFLRQGVYSDSSTVSLLGLAVADLISTVSMLWIGIAFAIALFKPPGLNWEPYEIMYMTGGWPHLISGLITRMLTALISFERCFCVVFPFKVRNVFTPRFSTAMVIGIFAYFIITYLPAFFLNTFQYVTDLETNRTRLILVEDPRWQDVQYVLGYTNLFTLNFCSVVMVLICTTITISRVKLSSAWRESMSTGNANNARSGNTINAGEEFESATEISSEQKLAQLQIQPKKMTSSKIMKEKKLVRMITVISVLFLACYLPNIAHPISYSYDPDIRTDGPYKNLSWVMFSISFFSETVNSSVNIFVYYKMSSRFSKEVDVLFGLSK